MSERFETAQDAEDAFYDAFEERDLEKIMSAWSESDDIICIQPMRNQVQGRTAVRKSWEEVFSANMKLNIEILHKHWFEADDVAVHIVLEQLIFNENRTQMPPPLIATNVYRKDEQGWHMVLHHVSPPPPPPMPQVPGVGPGMKPPPTF